MAPVVVVGSHRNGTSATTRALHLLGLSLVPDEDIMHPNEGNPDGYWESSTLTELDDRLLQVQGCSWSAPPTTHGEDLEESLRGFLPLGRQLVDRLLPGDRWIWKDPRSCLLLPFWREVCPEAVFLVVYRRPLSSADSLARRDGFSLAYGLALWQRYVASYLSGLAGAKTVVVSWDEVLKNPEKALGKVVSDLGKLGVELELNEQAVGSIRADARSHRPRGGEPAEAAFMYEELNRLRGGHDSFPSLGQLAESDWVEPLLGAHRRAQLLRVVPA
jgi:hypothetical protein